MNVSFEIKYYKILTELQDSWDFTYWNIHFSFLYEISLYIFYMVKIHD